MTSRQQINLNGLWAFWPDPDRMLTQTTLPDAPAGMIPVPGPWQADERFRHYSGLAWYRHSFELPADLQGQAIFLCFGAVDYYAEAWVNGERLGSHSGGYLPFEFDITASALEGTNTVIVCVADELADFTEIPHGKQSWYGMISGIWQPAWVELRPQVHIQRLHITPHDQEVAVSAYIGYAQEAETGSLSLKALLRSPAGAVIFEDILIPDILAGFHTSLLQFSCPVPDPQLWDLDTPYLYTLEASLVDPAGAAVDMLADQFGFRTIETRDGQILLNGRPLYLRAALDQDYYPDGFTTPPSAEFIEGELRKAKEMGLNCLRIHIKIGDPRYYAAADRLGLLVWTELPNWVLLSEAARLRARDTLLGMVERDWNHPSIIIWTIINEAWGVDLTNPEHRQWLRLTYNELKSIDPYRLVVDNSACWGNFHVATDLDDFHNYYAMPDHYDRWRAWAANFAERPWWSFAHDYSRLAAWHEFVRDPWNTPARPLSKEVARRGDEPLLVSEFGNWGLPDVEKLLSAYGGEPWWFETGLGFGEGVVYPHGVQQRFRDFHLERAFGDLAGLARQSQAHQFAALKYQIEQMRLHPSIQGYVITELTDVHWESNGLLDMQRQPKAHYPALGWLNHDNMVIPDAEQLAYTSRAIITIPLSLSHYARTAESVQSKPGLIPALVEWWVSNPQAGDMLTGIEGLLRGFSGPAGSVVKFGVLTFEAPQVEHPTHLKLELRWKDDAGSLMARNEVDLFIFPEPAQPGTAHGEQPPPTNMSRPGLPDITHTISSQGVTSVSSPSRPDRPVYLSGNIRRPALVKFLTQAGYNVLSRYDQRAVILANTLTDTLRQRLLDGARVVWLPRSAKDLQTALPGVSLVNRQGSPWQGDWASSLGWVCWDRLFTDLPGDSAVGFLFKDLTPEHVLTGFAPREFATNVHAGLFVGWVHKPVATIAERLTGRGRLLACTFRLTANIGKNPLAEYMVKEMLDYLFTDVHDDSSL